MAASHAAVPITPERPELAPLAVDTLEDGRANFPTSWVNSSGNLDEAWITLDLGVIREVTGVNIAPRADRRMVIDLRVGNELVDGRITGPRDGRCTLPSSNKEVPTTYQRCEIAPKFGRYLTVNLTNRPYFRVHAIAAIWAAGGGSPQSPEALFSSIAVPGTNTINFDADASTDPDGQVVAWDWQFGDGNTAVGKSPDHTYATSGTYTVGLTVTDDGGNTATTSREINVTSEVVLLERLPTTVFTVGTKASLRDNLIDVLGNGSQDLTSFWNTDGQLANAWFTMELDLSRRISELRIAPTGNRSFRMDVTVGDALENGRVSGPVSVTCRTSGAQSSLPSALETCLLPEVSGRFITVASTNIAWFKTYGLELWGPVDGVGNQPPEFELAADLTLIEGEPLTVPLAANDPDGPAPLTLEVTHDLPGNPEILTDNGDGTGNLTWDQSAGAVGDYSITVAASDGDGASFARTLNLAVVSNASPIIGVLEDRNATPGFELIVDVSTLDPDGPTPTTLTQTSTLPGVVLWEDYGDGTGQLRWTPDGTATGTFEVTMSADDSISEPATRSFLISVVTNQAPELTLPAAPLFVVEGEALSVDFTATDIDGPLPIGFGVTSDLPGLAPVIIATGDDTANLTWSAQAGDAGSYILAITTADSDGALSTTDVPIDVLPRIIKWNPGHYFSTRSLSPRWLETHPMCTEPAADDHITGIRLRLHWGDFETGLPGEYDTSMLDEYLEALAACGSNPKRLILVLDHVALNQFYVKPREEGGRRCAPEHVFEAGQVVTRDTGAKRCIAAIWLPEVREQYANLLAFVAARYNSHPRFEALYVRGEASTGWVQQIEDNLGFKTGDYTSGLVDSVDAIRAVAPNTQTGFGLNHTPGTNTVERLIEYALRSPGVGFAFPDTYSRTDRTFPHIKDHGYLCGTNTPDEFTLTGRVPIHGDNQRPHHRHKGNTYEDAWQACCASPPPVDTNGVSEGYCATHNHWINYTTKDSSTGFSFTPEHAIEVVDDHHGQVYDSGCPRNVTDAGFTCTTGGL